MPNQKTFHRTFHLGALLSQLVSIYLVINCLVFSVRSLPALVSNSDNITDGIPVVKRQLTSIDKQNSLEIYGFRVEGHHQWINSETGLTTVKLNSEVKIRVYGQNLKTGGLLIGLTTVLTNTTDCLPNRETISETESVDSHSSTTIKFKLTQIGTYYLCYSRGQTNATNTPSKWLYIDVSGSPSYQIEVKGPLIPLWVQLMLIIMLLGLSGLFSGLNLGLMTLDKNELKVIARCGTDHEKFYAKQITPVRKRGNYLLCTLLFGNVLVNSTLTILVDDLSSGIVAVVVSTLSIVVFGEIIPQALCCRHGLAVGARTVWLTYIFMVATFPLSYPISIILDKVIGEEIGNIYDRERLIGFIRVTKDQNRMNADEVNIISGALKLSKIKASEVMTQINDVFMLPYNTILNFQTTIQIIENGYSRIPVYENDRNNVVSILLVKDLLLNDIDLNLPINTLLFNKSPLYFVYENVTLDIMLNEFKKGSSHMAFVRKITTDGVNDPAQELVGVVTLEDVIEELIQAEINDETDTISDNRRKEKRKNLANRPKLSDFLRLRSQETGDKVISSQLLLACYQYLTSFVEPFTSKYISEQVLKKLMSKKIFYEVKVIQNKQFDTIGDIPDDYKLYKCGEPSDYFILILEGTVKTIIGKEKHSFDSGPFSYFGTSALKITESGTEAMPKSIALGWSSISDYNVHQKIPNTSPELVLKSSASTSGYRCSVSEENKFIRETSFIPDYSVYCVENTLYMKVTRATYLAAIRSTIMERLKITDVTDQQTDISTRLADSKSSPIVGSINSPKQSVPKQTGNKSLVSTEPKSPNSVTINESNCDKSLLTNEKQKSNNKQLTDKKSNEIKESIDK